MAISEKNIQDKLIEIIKNETFLEKINNKEYLNTLLERDTDENFLPGFFIDFLLRYKYGHSASNVLDSLSLYDLITGDKIQNISIESANKGVKERLFPDILLYNRERNQIIIIEVKKGSQTEREAIQFLRGFHHFQISETVSSGSGPADPDV